MSCAGLKVGFNNPRGSLPTQSILGWEGAPTGWDRQDKHLPAAASGPKTCHQLPRLSSAPRAEHKPPRCERRLRSKALRRPVWKAHKTAPHGSDLLPQQRLGRAINSPAKRGAANLSGAGCPRGQELREPCGHGQPCSPGQAAQGCVTCVMALSPLPKAVSPVSQLCPPHPTVLLQPQCPALQCSFILTWFSAADFSLKARAQVWTH